MMRKSTARTFGIIALISLVFLVPLLLAWWFYKHPQAMQRGTVNHGTLLQPNHNLAELQLTTVDGQAFTKQQWQGHWWLIYVAPTSCTKICQTQLYTIRQVRTATGKDRTRIQRALLTFTADQQIDPLLQSEYQGTYHLLASKQQFQQAFTNLASTSLALQQGYLYLVDPLGNLVLGYATDAKPASLLKDVQRLLRISQIG